MLITALLMAGVLSGGDPDGVVTTAPATSVDLGASGAPLAPSVEGVTQAGVPHNLTTDEQIDRWIATRSVDDRPYDRVVGAPLDDGLPHGEVSATVGTGGYRDYGAAVSVPIGDNGRLSLSYRQTENGYPYYGDGYGYGPGYGYRGAPLDAGGYVFPGNRPGAAAEYESRVMRPDGPPNRRPQVQHNNTPP